VLATSVAFMLWGRSLLSKQLTANDAETRSPSASDLIGFYGLADRWHRLRVSAGSPLINRSVIQMQHQYDRFGWVLVGLEKHPRGKPQFLPALPETVLEANDAIFVVSDAEQMRQLIATQQLVELPLLDERQRSEALQEVGAAEVMLAPESKLIGKTLGELEFRSRYHVSVLAIRRRGEPLTKNLLSQPLDFGDTLLVGGDWASLGQLWDDRENFVVLTLPAELLVEHPLHNALESVSPVVASNSAACRILCTHPMAISCRQTRPFVVSGFSPWTIALEFDSLFI
jgi:K+/H+ antiporter YhaU regulatory subunit KhtT